jgi:hypothetical protein
MLNNSQESLLLGGDAALPAHETPVPTAAPEQSYKLHFLCDLRTPEIHLPKLIVGDENIKNHSLNATVKQIIVTNCPQTSSVWGSLQ